MAEKKERAYVPIVWSEIDLLKHSDYNPSWVETDHKRLGELLYKIGMDVINYPVSVTECNHYPRSSPNKAVHGKMFSGAERLDNKWNQTGCMSLEACIASMEDQSIRQDMVEMATVVRFEEV